MGVEAHVNARGDFFFLFSFSHRGAKACIFFTPCACVHVCAISDAHHGRETPQGVNHGRLLCAAPYYHLVRGEESGHYNLLLLPAVCSTFIYRLKSSAKSVCLEDA